MSATKKNILYSLIIILSVPLIAFAEDSSLTDKRDAVVERREDRQEKRIEHEQNAASCDVRRKKHNNRH